jgi:iron(III) transport system ATP-binding protein
MPRLILSDVHKQLGGNKILKGVSFEISRGEVVALLGPSGSGKTTLLRAIAGLDHPDTGRIALDDQVFFDSATGQQIPAEKRNLGLVFQSYALWPHRTVFENVAYGLKLRRLPSAEITAKVSAVLAQIGLEALAARYPHQVSGGQQQRVALARALVYDPRLLLLDEPLSNLDAKLREEARLWLRELIQRLGISAVMVTHDQTEALAVADRILLLDQGRIEQDATPTGIYGEPATLFAAEFMGTNNRLEGRLLEVQGDRALLGGEGWSLWGQLRSPHAVGDAAIGIIRLEQTVLAAGPGENRLEARLETALYLGDRWDCLVRAGTLRLRVWTATAPTPGGCRVSLPPSSLWIF